MGTAQSCDPAVLRPWPMGLPLLSQVRRDPLGAMERFHAAKGDIAHLRVFSTDLYYLFEPVLARSVLVDHQDAFGKEDRTLEIFQTVHGANVITTDGVVWERQRRILKNAFTLQRIEACTGLMAAAAELGIDSELPRHGGEMELIDAERFSTRITMDVILRALFGYQGSREESDTISGAVRALSRQVMREFFWPVRPWARWPYPGRSDKRRHLLLLNELIEPQIRRRRAAVDTAAATDMLDLLLAARDEAADVECPGLTDEEIYANCVGLFGAGHDTSASVLTWWIGLMAAHPEVATRLRQEACARSGDPDSPRKLGGAPYLQATLKEAMRLYPPSTATFTRKATREVRLDGLTIPRGALVVVPIWSLHRDSRWFSEPEAFRPERFLPGAAAIPRGVFMPFGAGPHVCLGQQFAMVEMALIADRLVRAYDFALPRGAGLPRPRVDLVLKPAQPLNVEFTRRH